MTSVSQTILDQIQSCSDDFGYLIDLDHLTLFQFSGNDAESFLQGQLSNDISTLEAGASQLHAYCTPKGRALAILRIMRNTDGFWVLAPSDLSESLSKRLKMYVMRADVKIDIPQDFQCFGYIGNPENLNSGDNIYTVKGIESRYLVIRENDQVQIDNIEILDSTYWRTLDILSAIPQVYSNTLELFIPQNINMDLIDGISFKKGCYPGQEIIARIKYLGKSKQRLIIAKSQCDQTISPGTPVFSDSKPDSKSGLVVDAVAVDNGSYLISAMVPADQVENDQLTLNSITGSLLKRIGMPYSFV